MKSSLSFVLILTLCGCVQSAAAGEARFTTGLEVDGEKVLTLSYVAHPLENAEDIENLLQGRLSRQDLDAFNLGDKWARVATVEIRKEVTLGEIKVPAGQYPAGFNADEKGKMFFVVWVDGKARKTPIEVKNLKEAGPAYLTFLCGPARNQSVLAIVGGSRYALIPVKVLDNEVSDDDKGTEEEDWKQLDSTGGGFSGR